MAVVIDFAARPRNRVPAAQASVKLVGEPIAARVQVAANDPIFALFDAFKLAKAAYDAGIIDMARRNGRSRSSMAKIVQRVREVRRG